MTTTNQDKETPAGGDKPAPTPPDKLYSGKVRCTSTEGHKGYEVMADIELGQPMAKEGVFNAFKAHHAMARWDDFKIEEVDDFSDVKKFPHGQGELGVGEEKVATTTVPKKKRK